MTKQPAIFLDKDGTLVPDIPYNSDPARMQLAPGVAVGLPLLAEQGFRFVVVSNQSGVAQGYFKEADIPPIQNCLDSLLAEIGIALSGFYYCPHHPQGAVAEYAIACECRKPKPGLLLQAAEELQLDLPQSWMIGDILDDVEAGHAAGCRSALIVNGGETKWQMSPQRHPEVVAANFEQAAAKIVEAISRQNGSRFIDPSQPELQDA
jgi:D-glycero-D-manno-heptose 1,7-bisphosphate phosphatase